MASEDSHTKSTGEIRDLVNTIKQARRRARRVVYGAFIVFTLGILVVLAAFVLFGADLDDRVEIMKYKECAEEEVFARYSCKEVLSNGYLAITRMEVSERREYKCCLLRKKLRVKKLITDDGVFNPAIV